MNPRNCLVKADPPNSHGDCIRACVATILDRDDVPHVFDGRPYLDAWKALRDWLSVIGKTIAIFPTADHEEFMKVNNPGVPYILLYGAGRGNHAAIFRDGQKIHDPAWYRSSEVNPHSLGFFIVCIVGDLI